MTADRTRNAPFARTVHVAPRRWARGPARIDRGWIERSGPLEVYELPGSSDVLFDLIRVSDEKTALTFHSRHGMLRNGPERPHAREKLAEWWESAASLADLLDLQRHIRLAANGQRSGWDYLRKEMDLGKREYAHRTAKSALIAAASVGLSDAVNEGLVGTDWVMRFFAGSSPSADPLDDRIIFDVQPKDLLSYAYYDLATVVTSRVPLESCSECGRLFPVHDGRQRFCSSVCSNRARYKRWRARHPVKAQGGDK